MLHNIILAKYTFHSCIIGMYYVMEDLFNALCDGNSIQNELFYETSIRGMSKLCTEVDGVSNNLRRIQNSNKIKIIL